MIDHRTGNGRPPMVTIKGSGSFISPATQGPMMAPTKPMTIETIRPPRVLPAPSPPVEQRTFYPGATSEPGRNYAAAVPNTRIIITGGYSVDVFGKERTPTDRVTFLQKPYHPQRLLRTVRAMLDIPQPGARFLGLAEKGAWQRS